MLFKENEMVSTKTLYNELWAGRLPLSLFEVPDVLKRRFQWKEPNQQASQGSQH
jgi:hypothetical protein